MSRLPEDDAQLELPEREIGRRTGSKSGNTLVVIAGVHGNEPAGIHAARRVFRLLEASDEIELHGEFVAFAGNLGALRRNRRFHDRDLNRVWHDRAPGVSDTEAGERAELAAVIEAARTRRRGSAFLADLHTSSAPGIPFVVFGDTPAQRAFASALPIPILVGMEELIDGALSQYWTREGFTTLAVEGGQHVSDQAVDSLEGVIWLALCLSGVQAGWRRRTGGLA